MPGRLPRPEIQRLFEQADVYLAPARQESFGIAALEARCAGLPVVAMACGGVSDFISHGAEGFLAESDADMARAAAALLKSPDWLRDIQQHNRVSDPLMTWPRVLELTADAYRRAAFLVSRKPAGAEQIDSVGAQSSATSVGGDPG
jgi:glycosyltransferase involved in cell wall biosynthesis